MRLIAVRAAIVVVSGILLTIAALYVLQLGPFNTRPSAAAKAQPKVAAAVGKTQAQADVTVAKAETRTQTAAVAAEKKAETHVAAIRRSTAHAPAAAVPDGEFYRGVCDTQLYAGNPDWRRYGGQPLGRRARDRAPAVRGRAAAGRPAPRRGRLPSLRRASDH